jgi:hypothetical protein
VTRGAKATKTNKNVKSKLTGKVSKNTKNSKKSSKISKSKAVATKSAKSAKTKTVKANDKTVVASRGKDLLKNIKKPFTLSQQITYLSEVTGLPKKEVSLFMNSLEPMISFHLKNLQEISVGGLMKIIAVKKPATKAREGINPFTGQPTIFKAKPARKVIKIRPLKKVKEMV